MTGDAWRDLAVIIACCILAPIGVGVLAGFLLHWTLELRDLLRAGRRGTLPP